MALSAVHNQELEKRRISGSTELGDPEIIDLLLKEVKRREAAELFRKRRPRRPRRKRRKGNGSFKEISAGAAERGRNGGGGGKIIAGLGAVSEKDFGKVMGAAVKELKGKADSSVIGKAVKAKLGVK